MLKDPESHLLEQLPDVRGTLQAHVALAPYTWFRVGGPAEVLFRPADAHDLAAFLGAIKGKDIPLTVLGVGSNSLVRDGGIEGVVIRLGRAFGEIEVDAENAQMHVGAAVLDAQAAEQAARHGIAGLEFLRGIPGTIGGALTMNAGAYGAELKDVLIGAEAVTFKGDLVRYSPDELSMSYRKSAPPEPVIFTAATLQGFADQPEAVQARMADIMAAREDSQPVRERTGGSTFKNPDLIESDGRKAWQLIDEAGCRGLRIGGAMVSTQHCNFLINTGTATADDLEQLGEEVRRRVSEKTGVTLNWEIRRLGHKSPRQAREAGR